MTITPSICASYIYFYFPQDLGDVFPASNGGASALKEKHATATVVARIPFDSKVSAAGDKGVPLGDSPTQKEFVALAKALSS